MSWRETDHPRNPHTGEFVDKRGGSWLRQLMSRLPGQGRQDLRGVITEPEYKAMVVQAGQRRLGEPPQGDQILHKLYDRQGYHARPQVVSQAELDKAIAGGWNELWRGVKGIAYPNTTSAAEVAEDFRRGDIHRPGEGIYGNGTYVASTRSVAVEYTEDSLSSAGLIRMAMSPDTKIADYGDMVDEWHKMQAEFDAHYAAAQAAAGVGPDEYPWGYSNYKTNVLSDMGRLATAMGYDVMRVRAGASYRPMSSRGMVLPGPNPYEGDYYVVFNRGILKVQEA